MATFKKRPNGTWQVTVRKKGHPPQYKTFSTKALCQRWAREAEGALDAGTHLDLRKAEKMLLADAIVRYEAEITPTKKSQRTERAALVNLREGLAHRTLASLNADHVREYAVVRQVKVTADTVRRELSILSDLYVTARALWHIECSNPVSDAKAMLAKRRQLPSGEQRERRLLDGELQAILAVTYKKPTDLPALIEFALETAMRRGEIWAMRRAHIDWKKSTLVIPESKTDHQTGEDGRTVPLSPRALEILRGLPARLDGMVWLNTDVDSITRGLARAVARARGDYEAKCAKERMEPDPAFLNGLRFHDLRHEATSRLFEMGLQIQEVAAITGHKDWKSLKRYTHPQADQLAKKLSA